jgi:probable O-glycosylation ligase (exosortase A-associated)
MRTIFILALTSLGLGSALVSRHLALLVYVWISLFRPFEWVYVDLTWMRLSLMAGLLLLVPSILTARFPNVTHPLSIMSWLFMGAVVVAQLTTPVIVLNWEYVDQFVRLLVVSLLAVTLLDTKQRLSHFIAMIGASIGFYSAKGGVAALMGSGVRFVDGIGAFPDNNDYAMAVNMAIPFMAVSAATLQVPFPGIRYIRKAFIVAIPLSVITIIGTSSRGGLVAMAALAVVVALLQKRRFLWLGGMVLAGVLTYNFAPMPEGYLERMNTMRTYEQDNETSALGRLHFWEVATIMARENPLGIGLRYYNLAYDQYDPLHGYYGRSRAVHSSHFQVLAETGYLGMLLWVGLFAVAFGICLRIRFSVGRLTGLSDEDRRFYTLMSTALAASMFAFVVGGTFLAAAANDLTWLTFGGVAAMHRLYLADERALRPPVVADRAAPVMPRPRRKAIA